MFWDSNQHKSNNQNNLPTLIKTPPDLKFVQVSAGEYHSCALTTIGTIYCWGRNPYGQLGDGSKNDSLVPTEVKTLTKIRFSQVTVGSFHSCALSTTNKAYCWGLSIGGQYHESILPVIVTPSESVKFTQIDAKNTTCAISNLAKAYCWGNNNYGQLANSTIVFSNVPLLIK